MDLTFLNNDNYHSPGSRISKRRRGKVALMACNRCKALKRRCDGNFNGERNCFNCEKIGLLCEFDERKNPNYVKLLEDKVRSMNNTIKELEKPQKTFEVDYDNSLIQCAASIPLKDESEPAYIGSSGLSVTTLLQSCLISEACKDSAGTESYCIDEVSSSNNSAQIFDQVKELLKDNELVTSYFDNYFSIIHKRYPFLQKSYMKNLHDSRFRLFYDSNIITKTLAVSNFQLLLDKFTLIMIYGIGARLKSDIKSMHSNRTSEPHHLLFYKYALGLNLYVILLSRSISNIQSILLLVVYQLRFPNGPVIWYLVGSALRLCVNFGLHRRNLSLFRQDPYSYINRCRTFWSAYSLERIISNSFGRPFSLSDRDIDIDLPINIDDQITDAPSIKAKFYETYPHYNIEGFQTSQIKNPETRTSDSLAIQYFKLRKIDSRIQSIIYRVDEDFENIPRREITKLQQEMRTWINELPPFLTDYEYDYCLYLYHKQIRSLMQPFLNKLTSDDTLFIDCMQSSIIVCKLSRKIHQTTNYFLSFVSLQTIFLAGISIIYGLLFKKLSWDFEVSEGLRNCTTILVLIAERSPSCHRYRDIVEKLLDKVSVTRNATDVRLELQGQAKDKLPDSTYYGQGSSSFNESFSKSTGGNVPSETGWLDTKKSDTKDNRSHIEGNLNRFNEITKAIEKEEMSELDRIFDFSNLDELFYRLGGVKTSHSDWGIEFL
ncbi:uncharacterized protein PRCAT00005401001 [Priceomyces carsonii]|uniref:uncharacterized protein n=1 Tax=Priceomyces carsonii TaxID=28549 RepID=UPI002ED77DFA|nr:unnamed protein product [Priceomyces carsonii]